uniref:ShKT domain-containing protein n=1 Tax=Ditylenchus dipsaci TaxID=166011 RepID=A0A915D7V8_9BILA
MSPDQNYNFYCKHELFLLLSYFLQIVHTWPDGAPCVHAVVESMNPLEAVEHQGGLQLTIPPFFIEVDQKCYWPNQPVAITLRGNTTAEKFKGFAIQPLVYKGPNTGTRIGQFLRLDDNGSWQQQCFKTKNAVTHSHDEPKKRMQLWWKNDQDDTQYVQFVATVVVSLRKFWVKTVLSDPLPPCSVQQRMGNWQRDPMTPPPPVSSFKMSAFQMFNKDSANFIENSISAVPFEKEGKRKIIQTQTPAPSMLQSPTSSTTQASTFKRRLNHIIPIPGGEMEMNKRPRPTQRTPFVVRFSPLATTTTIPTTMRPSFTMRNRNNFAMMQTPQATPINNFGNQNGQGQQLQNVCRDFDARNQCFGWISFCGSSMYMRTYCQRTCRFC